MKRFLKFFVTLALVLTVVAQTQLLSVHAREATTLIVNYHRFDGNYNPWSLWLWQNQPTPGDGQNIQFNGFHPTTGSRQLELDLAGTHLEGATRVGVIVRQSDWTKDAPIDLFIDLTQPDANGVVEVFLVSQDPNVYYGLDEVDLSHRIQQVDFLDLQTISFESSTPQLDASDVRVLANGEPVAFTNFTMTNLRGRLTLSDPVDLNKTYEIEATFFDHPNTPRTTAIGFRGVYASDAFNDAFFYDGELGAIHTPQQTTFKLWAPIASAISLNLYDVGHPSHLTSFDGVEGNDTPISTHTLTNVGRGVWEVTIEGDLHGVYYTYDITNNNVTHRDVVDPYTRSTGVNGLRGMVVDFSRLNPEFWQYGFRPNNITRRLDSIIYEAHIRDYTAHETWNGPEEYVGKYLGFVHPGTTHEGMTTGFDHIIELGVTHVQLLPVHDIGMAIDETRILDPDYRGRKDTIMNWGYMTLHFNTLEGSYATDPFDGSVRIVEFKHLVEQFHNHNVRVILDVVYNHTATSGDSNFEKILPGYFFRFDENGNFSNGSGTGNETASEHAMMRRFIVDSLVFWAEEYNISGFRFDLMRLHDVETMRQIREALDEVDPTILVFGEPWDAGGSQLDPLEAAYFPNLDRMPGVGVFNDDGRDGVKGSVFDAFQSGWIQGNTSLREQVRAALVGAVNHPEINFPATGRGAFALHPEQTINYVTAHDNNTLHDKLVLSEGVDTPIDIIRSMQKQANAIVLTSQGIPFLHGGVEMMRTKPCTIIDDEPQGECDRLLLFDHNSYRSPDQTNAIDWQWKVDHREVFDFYRGMIALRKSINVFTYDSAELINSRLTFTPITDNNNVISFFIYDPESDWEYVIVAHNNSMQERTLDLLGMEWNMVANRDQAGLTTIQTVEGTYRMMPNESVVLYRAARNSTWPLQALSENTVYLFNNHGTLDVSDVAEHARIQGYNVVIANASDAVRYFDEETLSQHTNQPLMVLNGELYVGQDAMLSYLGFADTTNRSWIVLTVSIIAGVAIIGGGASFILLKKKG